MMDNDLVAPRKLTETESAKLRSLLKSKLNLPHNDGVDKQQSEEDAGDLLDYAFAMIANGKNVGYVTEELKSMEMEVCDAASAKMLGRTLARFLGGLDNDNNNNHGKNVNGGDEKSAPKREGRKEGTLSGNALASSGALGSSRAKNVGGGGGSNFDRRRDAGGGGTGEGRSFGGRGSGRGGGGRPPPPSDRNSRSLHGAAFDRLAPQDHRHHHHRDNRNNNNNNGKMGGPPPPRNSAGRGGGPFAGRGGMDHRGGGGRGGRFVGGRGGRDDRGGRDQRGEPPRGGGGRGGNTMGRGEGGRNDKSFQDRGGRGGGRNQHGGRRGGERDHSNNRDGRGGRGGRAGTSSNNLAGRRRRREEDDEEDFVAMALERGLDAGRDGGSNAASGSGGRGRGGRGRGRDSQQHAKRHRYDEGGSSHQTNDYTAVEDHVIEQDNGASWDTQNQGGRGGGRGFYRGGGHGGRGRGGRGRGRGRGRFGEAATSYINKNETTPLEETVETGHNATEEAAAVSESPLIAASFGRGGGRGGRGFYRGGRGRGRGRGAGRAGRSEVAEMISAKTWKRPTTMNEGLSTGR